jgi:hypothetical protein
VASGRNVFGCELHVVSHRWDCSIACAVSVFVSRHCCKKRDVMALQCDIHCFLTSNTVARGREGAAVQFSETTEIGCKMAQDSPCYFALKEPPVVLVRPCGSTGQDLRIFRTTD